MVNTSNKMVFLPNTTLTNYSNLDNETDGFYNPFEGPYFRGIFICLYSVECAACLIGILYCHGIMNSSNETVHFHDITWNNLTNFVDENHGFYNPFEKPYFRGIFIFLYSLECAGCLIGNSMVLFAIARSPRLRSMTNFLLANLAMADFSVGVFCVLPNLSTFLHPSWVLGKAMCKIYYYIWNVSYIGSITILTVIAIERYIAILHPLRARNFMTNKRLVIVQVVVWLIALLYNIPYLIFYDTISFSDQGKEFCYSDFEHLESLKWMSLANLIVWYIMPLLLIGCMYYRVARALWKTTVVSALRLQPYPDINNSSNSHSHYNQDSNTRYSQNRSISGSCEPQQTSSSDDSRCSERARFKIKGNNNITLVCGIHRGDDMQQLKCFIPSSASVNSQTTESEMTVRLYETNDSLTYFRNSSIMQGSRYRQTYLSSSRRVAKARKKVIRLLISVVTTFGVCVLPHMMKVVNHYWMIFDLPHSADTILSPISFIVLYLNSVLNPFLYAMFSTNFRRSFKEALPCFRRGKPIRKL